MIWQPLLLPVRRPAERNIGLEKGFVLAEVLVVSVIVAILAAVAVPIYTGYVRGQKIENVKNLAQMSAIAANAYYRRHGTAPANAADLRLYLPDPGKYLITVVDPNVTVTDASDGSITASIPFR